MTAAPTDADVPESLSFPRQRARTLNFTLGAPRSFTVTADGECVLFVRSSGPTDRAGCLWAYDLASSSERLLADPASLLVGSDSRVPPEELARRERMREATSGITGYSVDKDGHRAAFALDGRLFVIEIASGQVNELPGSGVIDPRLSPDGRRVAFVSGGSLLIVDLNESGAATAKSTRSLVEPDGPNITWGLAEFVAAEEMNRARGYWWSPESTELLVARVDESPVREWTIADPANPDASAHIHRYPAAGTNDADVTLWRVDAMTGERSEVVWIALRSPTSLRSHGRLTSRRSCKSLPATRSPVMFSRSAARRQRSVSRSAMSTGLTRCLDALLVERSSAHRPSARGRLHALRR